MLTNSSFPNNWTKNLVSFTPVSRQSKSRRLVRLRRATHSHLFAKSKIALHVNTYLISTESLQPLPGAPLPFP